jgi:hypothetical protein
MIFACGSFGLRILDLPGLGKKASHWQIKDAK